MLNIVRTPENVLSVADFFSPTRHRRHDFSTSHRLCHSFAFFFLNGLFWSPLETVEPLELCIFIGKSIPKAPLINASDCHLSVLFIYYFTLSTALKFIIIAAINNRDQMSRLRSVWCTSFLYLPHPEHSGANSSTGNAEDVGNVRNTKCKLLGFYASFLFFSTHSTSNLFFLSSTLQLAPLPFLKFKRSSFS